MELGEKIRLARLEAGLSQRQLCGDTITRNMLSQIEHGTAKPSMKTLAWLAEGLGKPISYFLEEQQDTAGLESLGKLRQAETAIEEGRYRLAADLLTQIRDPRLQRRCLLLMAQLPGADPVALCDRLPSLDGELLLRAEAAFRKGQWDRCLHLLEAAETQDAGWYLLRGKLAVSQEAYSQATAYLRQAEQTDEVFSLLERCYRELEDYKQAYFYACKQKK